MKKKKFLSIIMALIMVLAMVPSTAFAASDIVANFYNGSKYLSSAVADADGFITKPAKDPTGVGSNKFDGWYVDDNGNDKYDDGEDFDFEIDTITADTKILAKWLVKAGYNVYNAEDLGSKLGTLNAEWTVQGSGFTKWNDPDDVKAYFVKKGWANDADVVKGFFDKDTFNKIKKGTVSLEDATPVNLANEEAEKEAAYYAIISTTPATTHDVTFKYSAKGDMGGYYEVAPDEVVAVVEGETVAEPTVPTVEGGADYRYEFDGWYVDGNAYDNGEPFDFNSAINDATTVYGMFKKVETVTITFDAGEHGDFDGSQTVDVDVVNGGAVDSVPVLTINGTYALLGWQMSENGISYDGLYDTEYLENNAHLTKSVTFTAQYENTDKVTLTFDANGGTLPWNSNNETWTSDLVDAGTTVADLGGIGTDPARDGWTFAGWFDEDGNTVNNDTVISSTMTITAKWTNIVKYFVSANGDFSKYVATYDIEVEADKAYPEVDLVANDIANSGDVILGWYERAPWLVAKRANDVTLLTDEGKADLSTTNTTELFAMVMDSSITDVTFNPNNGSDVEIKSGKTIGEAFGEEPRTDLTKDNRTFGGWFYADEAGEEDVFTSSTLVTANMEVYAKWDKTAKYYVVADDITSSNYVYISDNVIIDENESFENLDVTTVTDMITSKDTVIGWYDRATWLTAKNGNDPTLLTAGNKADLSVVTGDLFAYVITDGNLDEFTVTYDLNGVTADAINNKTVKDGYALGDAGKVTPTNVQEGKEFLYWKAKGVSGEYDFTAPVTGNITLVAVWADSEYTVNFIAHDGTNELDEAIVKYNSQTVVHGGKVTEPETKDVLGYNFVGWYETYAPTNMDLPYDFANKEVIEPITLYGVYNNVGTANINFVVGDNGTTTDETSFTITKGRVLTAPVVVANEGYKFLYWQCGDGTYSNEEVNALHFNEDLAFTAVYEDTNAVTVTFAPNNGHENSQVPAVKNNVIAAENMPSEPVKTDRTFMGWFAADGSEFTAETVVTGDILVTAKWGRNVEYRIYKDFVFAKPLTTILLVDESVAPQGIDLVSTEIDGAYLATSTDTIYGWFTNNEWKNTINGNKDTLIATTPSPSTTGTQILCAMIETDGELEDYTVTYNLNKVTADAIAPKTVKETKLAEDVVPENVQEGKIFLYWKAKGESGKYDFQTPISGNLELVAVWADAEFDVNYVAIDDSKAAVNNVDYSTLDGKVKYGETIAAAPTTQEEVGYVFKGWYTDDAGITAFTFGTDTITAKTTLYAIYENVGTVTVEFVLGDKGTTTDVTSFTITKGEKITVPTVTPGEKYEFAYWADAIGDKVENIENIEFMISETFTAVYTDKEVSVTFDLQHYDVENEADFAAPTTVKYGEDVTAPIPVPTSRYVEFAGWYTDAACTEGNEFDFIEVKASATAYAKWNEIKTYKVNFVYSLSEAILSDFNEEVEVDVDDIAAPSATLPEGYRVKGWQKMVGGRLTDTTITAFNSDITLYAKLEVEVSLNVYKNNSATPEVTWSKTEWIDKGATAYADALYNKYATFNGMNVYGWYTDAELDNFRNGSAATTIADIVATAPVAFNKVANEVYEVTFDTLFDEPASPAPQSIEHYKSVDTANLTLEKNGYIFNGWKVSETEDVITVENLAAAHIVEDMDFVADWTPIKQTVHFVTGGYSDAITDKSVDYDTLVTAPVPENVKEGYRFAGWYTDEALTTEFDFANTTITEETTVYAKWEVKIVFNIFENYGSAWPVDSKEVWTQLNTPIESQDLSRYANDTVYAWFSEAGWSELYAPNSDKTFDTAKKVEDWTATVPFTASAMVIKNYTVKFTNAEGIVLINNTELPVDQKIAYNKVAMAPTEIMERNGWDFDKWLLNGVEYDFATPVTEDITLVSSWIPTSRTVAFDAYGIVTIEDKIVDNKGKVTAPDVTMPEGYELLGWYTDEELTIPYNFNAEVTESFTLYAKINVTVTYKLATNSITPNEADTKNVKVQYNTNAELTRAGEDKDTFNGWYSSDVWASLQRMSTPSDFAFDKITALTELTVTAPVTIYGAIIENYTVKFTSEANTEVVGMPEAKTVAFSGKVKEPVAPTRVGYDFAGWYINSIDGEEYTFGTPVLSDITLVARWDAHSYVVTYDANGGIFTPGTVTEKTVKYLDKYGKLLDDTSVASGNGTFVGWYLDAEGTEGNEVTKDTTYTSKEDTTLYAKWKKSLCVVNYDSNGGDEIAAETINSGSTITHTEATRDGFVFEGWYTDEALTQKFDVTTPIRATLTTLYAKWQVEVTFVAYTNYTDVKTKVVTVDENADLEEVALSELGITLGDKDQFDGWFTDAEFAKYQNGEAATAYTFDKATEKLTLTGNVLRNYVVTFNYKDDDNKVETQDVLFNQTATQPDPNPAKTGYKFTRWVAEGADATYDFGTPVTGNLVINARWTVNSYPVNFVMQDDTTQTVNVEYNKAIKAEEIPNTDVNGYIFMGWFADGSETAFDLTTPITEEITLTGVWKLDVSQFNVTFTPGNNIYSGSVQKTNVTVSLGDKTLVEGEDYEVVYSLDGVEVEPINASQKYVITVNGIGDCTGTKTADEKYIINRKNITLVTVEANVADLVYTGSELTPVLTINDTVTGKALVKDTDYSVVVITPATVKDAGEYTYKITGEGNYKADRELTFKVEPKAVTEVSVEASVANLVYTGANLTPVLTINDTVTGKALVEGTDYSVTEVTPSPVRDAGEYTYKITGEGNYKADRELSFKVEPKSISLVTVAPIESVDYDGTPKTPVVLVTDGEATLVAGTDYDVMTLNGNTNAGTVTITIAGKGNYTDAKLVNFTINARTLVGNATIADIADQNYTGSPVEPKAVVTDKLLGELTEGIDYKVTYTNNTSGIATLTVEGIGNYTGSISTTFKVGEQLYYITGIVKYVNGRIIRNATVKLVGTDLDGNKVSLSTKTDYSGRYTFDDLRYGEYTVSYLSKSQTGILNEQ